MTLEEAKQLLYGVTVTIPHMALVGSFQRMCGNEREIEVLHAYDGGGVDFWPIEEAERVLPERVS